ncbi:MAG: exodeoxyribonuclease III [Eubacteriaceae bacterium]|nr:exodeoxyribonuclease III [Eubacteriaceae bacterium]
MKLVSWNVNGLRACMGKGFADYFGSSDADIFCIQETKLQKHQLEFCPEGYETYISDAQKKGYSGTAVFTRHAPDDVIYGIDGLYNDEGRLITLEYRDFYFICCYSPNSQDGLKRLDYRMTFEDDLRGFMTRLDKQKPVILTGDLNVAHEPIDLKNPSSNTSNAGFTPQEREKFTCLLDAGFSDVFRTLNPELKDAYSWWSYRFRARERNAGWRIDYFLVSNRLMEKVKDCTIENSVFGSDHCPVTLDIELTL